MMPHFPTLPQAFPLSMPVVDHIPVGAVLPFAGELDITDKPGATAIEPWGWLPCDGRTLAIAAYPQLYAALGTRYGGSGEHFNIPDYRGLFLRGVDAGSGLDPDANKRTPVGTGQAAEVGSLQQSALRRHDHIYQAAPNVAAPGPPGTAPGVGSGEPKLTAAGPTDALKAPGTLEVSDKETRPINISIHFVIKYAHVFRSPTHAMPF